MTKPLFPPHRRREGKKFFVSTLLGRQINYPGEKAAFWARAVRSCAAEETKVVAPIMRLQTYFSAVSDEESGNSIVVANGSYVLFIGAIPSQLFP